MGLQSFFTVGDDSYLAIAGTLAEGAYLDQDIYRWNGLNFEYFTDLNTAGIYDWEHFSIDDSNYLAAAQRGEESTVYLCEAE